MTRRSIAAGLGAAALFMAAAMPAHAAPRDLDPTFGDEGLALTPIGPSDARGFALARQGNGRLVAAGEARIFDPQGDDRGVAIARYLEDGTLDPSFGGGDGIVLEQFSFDGSDAQAVAIQPDGRILVAGTNNFYAASVYVARYLADGSRDASFGVAGVARVQGICCDFAVPNGLAVAPGGRIVVAGTIDNTETSDSFVARLTPDGDPDATYGTGGFVGLQIGDGVLVYSRANALVLQGGKAVIAGDVLRSSGKRDLMLARLDEQGELDESFGDLGVVQDPVADDSGAVANDLAKWNGKLVVAGSVRPSDGSGSRSFVLARYSADGELDGTLRPNGPNIGHFVMSPGSNDIAEAFGLAVDPATGSITVTGSAVDQTEPKLLIARYTSEGVVDPDFQSSNGNIGYRLLDANDAPDSETIGRDVVLDPLGRTLVAGWALDLTGRRKFLVARLGDSPPPPNLVPVARISGHRTVPRKTFVTFHGRRSFDPDGEIVNYAWRVGNGRFHSTGGRASRRIRFGRTGVRTVTLRVTDDEGAVAYATRRVRVLSRRGAGQRAAFRNLG